jgi:pSer/pThr/pTyr-binding forkhead associated (FHA) protein
MAAPARAPSQARPASANPQPLPQGAKTDPELAHGRLILVRRDGSDGEVHPLVGEVFDVGRLEGSLTFSDDPYLAPRHARFTWNGTVVKVRSIDGVNGVFVRVRGGVDLTPGDTILIGKEVLRYEPLSAEERDPPSLVEHGVRIFGSVQREAWGRLRQLTGAGTTRDVFHLTRPELVLGREEGDVTFPDDEYLSRRHATVKRAPAGRPGARLEDMNSSNGTYLRLRGEVELKQGDVLRLGDHLLRFEP